MSMNMSGRHTSRLAASFNATLAGSQVQGLLDGASISSNEGVSGIVPQGADQLLDDVTTHSSGMDHCKVIRIGKRVQPDISKARQQVNIDRPAYNKTDKQCRTRTTITARLPDG